MRYLIQLAYKGTNYHGWQKQHNAHSVQSVLDKKISLLLAQNIETLGCGRTDTGVHAKDFYAHFDAEGTVDCEGVVYRLNRMLPFDISVYDLKPVDENFNARFDATYREYEYWITQKRDPFLLDEAWYQYGALNVEEMNKAALQLIGKKDFECFSKVQTQVNNFICDVQLAEWKALDDKLIFTIRANRFLRNMVRAIVGTLVDIGKGRITQEDMEQILASKNRSEAGHSVPAHGLYLTKVVYTL